VQALMIKEIMLPILSDTSSIAIGFNEINPAPHPHANNKSLA